MASRREEKQEDVRLRVMRIISANPEVSTREVAAAVGVSNGSAFYVLTGLAEKGFVELENFKKCRRKRQYTYLLTPKGLREKSVLAHRFITRKRQEFTDLQAEICTLEEELGIIPQEVFTAKIDNEIVVRARTVAQVTEPSESAEIPISLV